MRFARAAIMLLLLLSLLGVVAWVLRPMSATDDSEHGIRRQQELSSATSSASELAEAELQNARTGKSRSGLEVPEGEEPADQENDDEEEWLKIRVVNDRGEPILDALSYYTFVESPTDENGEVEVFMPKDAETFWVSARGYEVLALSPPMDRTQTFEITLLESVMLHVKWMVPERIDLGSLRIRFDSDGLVFLADADGRTDVPTKLRAALGMEATDIGNGWGSNATEFCTIYPGDTEMDVWGLMPGVEMEVSLVNGDDQPVSNKYFGQWVEGEEEEIWLVIKEPLKTLSLFVHDEAGIPLDRVAVEYRYREVDGFDNSRSVGSDGRITLEGIPAKTMDLLVRPSGFYGAVFLDDFVIPSEGEVLEVVLRESRNVSVHLQTPDGQSVSGSGRASENIARVQRLKGPPPSLSVGPAPQHAFDLHWKVGGCTGVATIPAGVAEHVIVVPAMGSASLHSTRTSLEGNYLYLATFEGDHANAYPFSIFFGFPEGGLESQREVPQLQAGWHQVKLERMNRETGVREFLSDYGRVEVKAGEVARLELEF